ncbi:Hypothetical protein R9X50_00322700 [Acrodontium crateriforme]|uniref:SURF6-domain-containing protein n=1 Tax=Acrodontium crateriforme TaxID=150365 RepID=A0AAQ3M2X3_9PEZI|nr:Hypothetical protein R9X50_00322700 [Acrodontium crateriforme]
MDSEDHGMDSMDGLEERLQNANNAFESILALTPAPEYFGSQIADGKDPSEQWNRKKQTAAEKRAAKKAKLDPANQKSALDIMKERERKRKRELGIADDEATEDKPQTNGAEEGRKRQKAEPVDDEAKRRAKAEKRKEKRHAKQEKIAAKKAKAEAKKAAKQDSDLADAQQQKRQSAANADEKTEEDDEDESDDDDSVEGAEQSGELNGFDASGLEGSDVEADDNDDAVSEASSAPSTPAVESPAFDIPTNHSTTSSASSIIPPSKPKTTASSKKDQQTSKKPSLKLGSIPAIPSEAAIKASDPTSGTSSPKLQLPNIDQAELQERLRQRIEALRAARKADGPEGKPARSRQELLEQRRKKEEQRKAAKKEQRRKQKEDEQLQQEAQLRGSGSPLSGDIFDTHSPQPQENNFSFSRLAFEDGTTADASMTTLNDARRVKGRSDPKTALLAAQNKQKRIAGLDAEKQADIAEKDLWLNAKKRAHGERVRDDTSLLKKALKRKEKAKNKSESAWRERQEAVAKGKELKDKRRETNLAKRRDEKGSKGKKKGGVKGGKKKGRPGFEGRFKA